MCLEAMNTLLSHWDQMLEGHLEVKGFHLRDRSSVRDPCKCDYNWGNVSSVGSVLLETW